jgi:RNA polymerase sigma factor (sigma-70 family)
VRPETGIAASLRVRVTLVFVPAKSRVMTNRDVEDRFGRERLEDLFRRHEPAVVAYLRRRAPADVVDDIVAETWRRLDDVREPALPWLLGVARRVLSTHRRGDRRRQELDSRLAATQSRAVPAWSEDGEERALVALATLSEKDREALTLIAWEGLTPQQAAVVLDEPAVRFRVRLHRAKRRIKALLEQPSSTPPRPTTPVCQGAADHD